MNQSNQGLNEAIDSTNFILLAPRMSASVAGHRYWFPRRIYSELNRLQTKVTVIANSEIDRSELKYFQEQVSQFKQKLQWGQDSGKLSPSKITNEIRSILGEDRLLNEETIFYSYETSLALAIAMMKMSAKYSNLRFSLNLIDDGFWESVFSSRILRLFGLRKSFFENYSYLQSRARFTCNSEFASMRYSELVGTKLDLHRSFYPEEQMDFITQLGLNIEEKIVGENIVFFFWEANIDFLRIALKQIYTDDKEIYSRCTFQIKSEDLLYKFNKMLAEENLPMPKIIFGELSLNEYTSMITNASAVAICYTDYYHRIGGSGRLIDCLCLGTPVIVPNTGALSELADAEGGTFFYDSEEPKSLSTSISNFLDSEYYLGDVLNLRNNLSEKSINLYSVQKIVNTLLTFHLRKQIETRTLFKGQFYINIRILELNWFILRTYQSLQIRWQSIKKLFKKSTFRNQGTGS